MSDKISSIILLGDLKKEQNKIWQLTGGWLWCQYSIVAAVQERGWGCRWRESLPEAVAALAAALEERGWGFRWGDSLPEAVEDDCQWGEFQPEAVEERGWGCRRREGGNVAVLEARGWVCHWREALPEAVAARGRNESLPDPEEGGSVSEAVPG